MGIAGSGIADIGIEDLRKHGQPFGLDELLVVQKAAIRDNGGADHVLNPAENLGADIVKTPNRCQPARSSAASRIPRDNS